MQHHIERLHREKQQLEKALPHKKGEAANRMFDVMIEILEDLDSRLEELDSKLQRVVITSGQQYE